MLEVTMMRRICRLVSPLWFLGACMFCNAALARSREPDSPVHRFNRVKRVIVHKLTSKRPSERLAGVKKASEFPTAGSAELLVNLGLANDDKKVRDEAYETLLTFTDQKEVREWLYQRVKADLLSGTVESRTCGSLQALLSSDSSDAKLGGEELLALAAATPLSGQPLLIGLADRLAERADEASRTKLVGLTQIPAFDNLFGVRRAVVQGLMQLHDPEAVGSLIGLLAKVRGEVRADIGRYLIEISGRKQSMAYEGWTKWWESNKDTFRYPTTQQGNDSRTTVIPDGTSSYYYGVPIYAERVVFVIDTSDSMAGPRLATAKLELITAITGLTEGSLFNVLTFNGGVHAWSPQLVPANAVSRQLAADFVAAQQTQFATFSYDALVAALSFDSEAIYFLTDGEPFGGTIEQPNEIVAAITESNRSRRVTINSIGIGIGNSLADRFLRSLAQKNYGGCRFVP